MSLHLQLPLSLAPDGSFSTVSQDSVEDVAQCVEVLLRTEQGSRIEEPDYGILHHEFDTTSGVEDVTDAITEWEPRASATLGIEQGDDELVRRILVRVQTNG